MNEKTKLESIADPLPNIAITLASTVLLSPATALIPVLTNTLASGRYQRRIQKELENINKLLEKQKDKLEELSDAQFKLVNESLATLLQTLDTNKIQYLRNIILNSTYDKTIEDHESDFLSRVVRDITAKELLFVIDNIDCSEIIMRNKHQEVEKESYRKGVELHVPENSLDHSSVSALSNFGLLHSSDAMGGKIYFFSPISRKLLKLIIEQ